MICRRVAVSFSFAARKPWPKFRGGLCRQRDDSLFGHGGRISGNSIDASGGAFNTGNGWHDVSFQCEVDLENYTVTEFRFKIGNAISPEDAKKRGFTRFQ
nr:DUF930 domain-containing protein [Rhizobium oryzihabitans]